MCSCHSHLFLYLGGHKSDVLFAVTRHHTLDVQYAAFVFDDTPYHMFPKLRVRERSPSDRTPETGIDHYTTETIS